MNILTRYVGKDGYIKTLAARITHDIKDHVQVQAFYNDVVKKYNDSILLIRGYIEDVHDLKTTATTFNSEKYYFNIKKHNLNFYQLREPAFGYAEECVKKNLILETQELLYKYTSYMQSVNINLVGINDNDDTYYLVLNEIRDTGLYSHVYKISFIFNSEWSSTCDSCQNGIAHLKYELDRISNQLYMSENNNFKTSGHIISDLELYDAALLKDQIRVLLANAIQLAKISDFEVVNITDEFKGIGNGEAT